MIRYSIRLAAVGGLAPAVASATGTATQGGVGWQLQSGTGKLPALAFLTSAADRLEGLKEAPVDPAFEKAADRHLAWRQACQPWGDAQFRTATSVTT